MKYREREKSLKFQFNISKNETTTKLEEEFGKTKTKKETLNFTETIMMRENLKETFSAKIKKKIY